MAIETTPPQSADWQELVARKRRDRLEKTPREWILSGELLLKVPPQLLEYDLPRRCGLLSESELDISESYTATQLLGQLALGQLSSLEVTTAFCKRAAIAQQVTSCLTETYFSQALDRARFLDEYLQREGRPIGPLHGLPISVKDIFCVECLQSTIGYVSFLKHAPATENSPLV